MTQKKYPSADEHLKKLQSQLRGEFAKHQLLDEQYWDDGRGARWKIGQPGTFVFRTEIIAGIGGSLLVHGDIDVCRYGHYGDHADAWSRLCWMGKCQDVGYYVAQKASIGMSRVRARDQEYDSDVACYDLERLVAEYREDSETDTELIELLTKAKIYTENEHELWQFIRSRDRWDLSEHHIGHVVPVHVVMTHEALKRAVELLEQKHGALGPPQCREKVNRASSPYTPETLWKDVECTARLRTAVARLVERSDSLTLHQLSVAVTVQDVQKTRGAGRATARELKVILLNAGLNLRCTTACTCVDCNGPPTADTPWQEAPLDTHVHSGLWHLLAQRPEIKTLRDVVNTVTRQQLFGAQNCGPRSVSKFELLLGGVGLSLREGQRGQ